MKQCALIIDDSQAVHALIRAQLAEEHLTVHSAYDALTGMSLAQRTRPDVILLDVDMPGKSGFELCQQLSDDPFTADVPVIFLTASGEAQQRVRGLEMGAADYIVKPFEPEEFSARVRNTLKAHLRLREMRSQRVDDFIAWALRSDNKQ